MSLITRCPACGTMFKVVTDQLKVSQGWVRCGHCAEVFDASLHLQATQETSAPDPANTSTPAPLPIQAQAGHEEGLNAPADSAVRSDHRDDRDVLSEFPLDPPDDAKDVSFVRDAKRRAFWRKPGVRVALGLFGFALVVLLVLQVLLQQRDSLVASDPAFKPWIQKLCEQLHCEVAPLRRMDSLVIDSSSFNKVSADSYRLTFMLKNSGAVAVAMPSLEVTLTDTQDQVLARRVLTPAQFGSSNALFGAGSDFPGVVVMQVLGVDTPAASTPQGLFGVAGYRVLIFYP